MMHKSRRAPIQPALPFRPEVFPGIGPGQQAYVPGIFVACDMEWYSEYCGNQSYKAQQLGNCFLTT